jgi:hypothetical protein
MPARLGAHAAMLVHLSVTLALVAAALADGHARLEQRPDDVGVELCWTAGYHGGSGAEIGAMQAQSNALDHVRDVRLAQVRVDVCGARLGAIDECVDDDGQGIGIDVDGVRVGVQNSPGVTRSSS